MLALALRVRLCWGFEVRDGMWHMLLSFSSDGSPPKSRDIESQYQSPNQLLLPRFLKHELSSLLVRHVADVPLSLPIASPHCYSLSLLSFFLCSRYSVTTPAPQFKAVVGPNGQTGKDTASSASSFGLFVSL